MIKINCFRFLSLLSGFVLLSPGYGSDVWDYARERSQRVEQKEMEKPAVQAPVKQKVIKKEKTPPSSAKSSRTSVKKSISPGQIVLPGGQAQIQKGADEYIEPVKVGAWIKDVINAIKTTPSEKSLRESYISKLQEHSDLLLQYDDLQEKLKMQQHTMQLLQRKLKQAQSPALPDEVKRREVFAAGMASGFNLLELIDERKSLGLDLNNEDFLAGIREALTGGNRLSKGEFELLINSMNQKVHDAEMTQRKKRVYEDANWLKKFSDQKNILTAGNGIHYKIIYEGDQILSEGETLFVALSRKSSSGDIIFDSDASDNFLEFNINNIPEVLKDIMQQLRLHGEAVLAMPVDRDGNPDVKSHFYEQWTIRIIDAGMQSAAAS
ncbi:FKBP-type peptidyl-prolyl cis-trans isomerase N-terminal domain-containing protein [Enterobacter asburiae]|uniref:FKBP-type peptidyl-prolyl cis-trans isomerase N-terminal domain-containing protein n=1 Tax=Enterobacter asburiae TaxID=61645 RepID=UPI000A26D613|nr:FKBP-type peptidyl-prolyl cis-trans isomerase N-terminal domain-containing protein [Enterobacter asburiae]